MELHDINQEFAILMYKDTIKQLIEEDSLALILILASYKVAQSTKEKPFGVIIEHLYLAIFVLILTYFAGTFISAIF